MPFGLICFSVVTVWYALHGHAPEDVTGHRSRARWYTTKTEPSYDDMAVKLRRLIIAARFRGPCPEQATPQETRAVLAAWAAARHMINKNCETREVRVGAKNAAHVTRRADTRGAVPRAGHAVGWRSSRSSSAGARYVWMHLQADLRQPCRDGILLAAFRARLGPGYKTQSLGTAPTAARSISATSGQGLSSIESASQNNARDQPEILAAPFAPPFAAIESRSVSSLDSPHRPASARTGTSPAHDTRFGSSNRTEIARRA